MIEQHVHKFRATINITDISDLSIIAIPSTCCHEFSDEEEEAEEEETHQDYLLQFSLIGIGEKLIFY